MAISLEALDNSFARAVRAANVIGIDSKNWSLHHGCTKYGRPWQVGGRADLDSGTWYWPNVLGTTRESTYHVLNAYAYAWEAAADALRERRNAR